MAHTEMRTIVVIETPETRDEKWFSVSPIDVTNAQVTPQSDYRTAYEYEYDLNYYLTAFCGTKRKYNNIIRKTSKPSTMFSELQKYTFTVHLTGYKDMHANMSVSIFSFTSVCKMFVFPRIRIHQSPKSAGRIR